jgi:hypothetical protein
MSHSEETYVGPLEPSLFTVTEQLQAQYLEALEDYNLRYLLGRASTNPIAHPGILLNYSNATRSPSFSGPNTRWIHVREQTRFTSPARLGDELVAQWRIEEHEPWFGHRLTRVSCAVTRTAGQGVLERVMWGLRASPRRAVSTRDDTVTGDEMDSSRCPASLNYADWELRGRSKRVSLDRIKLFSGNATNTLHTDEATARAAGLAAPIASATQGMGYLCEFMIDNFGEGWLAGGSWMLTFRKPIFADDRLSVFGRLNKIEPDDRGSQCHMEVRLVNEHGVTATQGSATCPWPTTP